MLLEHKKIGFTELKDFNGWTETRVTGKLKQCLSTEGLCSSRLSLDKPVQFSWDWSLCRTQVSPVTNLSLDIYNTTPTVNSWES